MLKGREVFDIGINSRKHHLLIVALLSDWHYELLFTCNILGYEDQTWIKQHLMETTLGLNTHGFASWFWYLIAG